MNRSRAFRHCIFIKTAADKCRICLIKPGIVISMLCRDCDAPISALPTIVIFLYRTAAFFRYLGGGRPLHVQAVTPVVWPQISASFRPIAMAMSSQLNQNLVSNLQIFASARIVRICLLGVSVMILV